MVSQNLTHNQSYFTYVYVNLVKISKKTYIREY